MNCSFIVLCIDSFQNDFVRELFRFLHFLILSIRYKEWIRCNTHSFLKLLPNFRLLYANSNDILLNFCFASLSSKNMNKWHMTTFYKVLFCSRHIQYANIYYNLELRILWIMANISIMRLTYSVLHQIINCNLRVN